MGGCYSSRTAAAAEGHQTYYSSMSSLPLPASRAASQTSLPTVKPTTKPVTRNHSGKRKDPGQDDTTGEVITRRPQNAAGRFGFGYKGSTVRPKSTDLSRHSTTGVGNNVSPNRNMISSKVQSNHGGKWNNSTNVSNLNGKAGIVSNSSVSSTNSDDNGVTTTAEDSANANITSTQNSNDNGNTKPVETSAKKKNLSGNGKYTSRLPGAGRFSGAKPRGPLLSKSMSKDRNISYDAAKPEVKATTEVCNDNSKDPVISDLNKNIPASSSEDVRDNETTEPSDVPDGSVHPADTTDNIPSQTSSSTSLSIQTETNIIPELSWKIPTDSSPSSEKGKESDSTPINSSVETLVPERQLSTEQSPLLNEQTPPFRKAKPTLKRAPLARFDSLETTSIGSINSDDLMLETDIGFDDDDCLEESQGSLDCSLSSLRDHNDKHFVPRMMSRSDSLREKASLSRCSSQSQDGRDNPGIFRRKSGEHGDVKFLRPHSKSGPNDSQSSLHRIVRRTSLPRNSNVVSRESIGMKEGSKTDVNSAYHSEQSQPLQELGNLMNSTGIIQRRPKLIRSERPASFPGLGLGDVASPRSRTGSVSGILKPPRQPSSIDDEEQYMIDGHTLRNLLQELTMFKTMLLKVKRHLQEDEIGSPFGPPPSWKNGFKCVNSSVPNSPLVFKDGTNSSSFSFSEKSVTEEGEPDNTVDKTAIIEQLSKDQHELRQQLASAQKQNDEQKRTIALLQQQMTKYECGNISKNGTKLTNSATQTDKPRFPLSRSLLAKPQANGKQDDSMQVISGSSEKIPDGKGPYKAKNSRLDSHKKSSKVAVLQNGAPPRDKAPTGLIKPKFVRLTTVKKVETPDETVKKAPPAQSRLPGFRRIPKPAS